MAQEIERKFLVTGEFKQVAYTYYNIKQGYICRLSGKTVRVRLRDEKGFLTIKGPSIDGGLSRYEWEQEIGREEAMQLMKLCEGGIIDKTRYLVKTGKHICEVDEFHGENTGLILAEIELSSPEESFEKPTFLGPEVTGDKRYYNSFLTINPYKTWGE